MVGAPLHTDTAKRLIALLDDGESILVAGQALAFWADRYKPRWDCEFEVVNSVDIDFWADRTSAARYAHALNGKAEFPPHDNDATPNTAIVRFTHDGYEYVIDCLASVYGVSENELDDMALAVEFEGNECRVMHPYHCMVSRIKNVIGLGRRDAHALRQLRASVQVLRHYLSERIETEPRAVLRIMEKVFKFVLHDREAQRAVAQQLCDPFDVVKPWAALPEKFCTVRYPQMVEALGRKRAKLANRGEVRRNTIDNCDT